MKIILTFMILGLTATLAPARSYHGPYPFDLHGCIRHLKAIVRAAKDAGGKVRKNDGSDRSYRVTLHDKTIIYTCTRYELLETELDAD